MLLLFTKFGMKLNAVGVTTSDMKKTIAFYALLGFTFPAGVEAEDHVEPKESVGSARLMIDSKKLITEILGEVPHPSNHSAFAIEYKTAAEVDAICTRLSSAGYTIVKEPWDAFWGQHYAIVEDPDHYRIDLYAPLTSPV